MEPKPYREDRNGTRYYLEMRSQHSVGSGSGKFGGPDTYVAVQVVPQGAEPLKALNPVSAERRGIRIERFGEGYRGHSGPRSALGQAVKAAQDWIDQCCS